MNCSEKEANRQDKTVQKNYRKWWQIRRWLHEKEYFKLESQDNLADIKRIEDTESNVQDFKFVQGELAITG